MVKTLATKKVTNTKTVIKPAAQTAPPKLIRYAADFSGLGASGIALRLNLAPIPELQGKHVWSCDKARASKQFIAHTDPADIWFHDVTTRDLSKVELKTNQLDLYSFTSPCQGLSKAGLQNPDDPRTALILAPIPVLKKFRPKTFMAENVSTLATDARFKPLFKHLLNLWTSLGYHISFRFLSSLPYVPQARMRLYILGIRKDVLRHKTCGVPLWPTKPVKPSPKLADIVVPLEHTKFKQLPEQNELDGLCRANVLNAYKTLPRDVNPFTTPIVVDMKASERYSSHKLNQIMTITATRASQRGYWCSIKGAVLNIDEMAKCQGWYPENFPWREAGLKEAAAGHCIGNSQTLPLVQDVIAHLLFHGSVISHQQFLAMKTTL